MDIASLIRRALVDLDVTLIRKVWGHVSPHLPQPKTREDALIALHVARTASDSVPVNHRLYSHAWLRDRGYPSRLPDNLKQSADRLYPIVVGSVGIAVGGALAKYKDVKDGVRGAMEGAVLDCYGMGDEDPKIVKPRMHEAKDKELKALFGLKRR